MLIPQMADFSPNFFWFMLALQKHIDARKIWFINVTSFEKRVYFASTI